jgi:DNA-binding XRE family transcriptional regulator
MKTADNRNHKGVDVQEAALTMAMAVLVERIGRLPAEDKDELLKLSKLLIAPQSPEEEQAAVAAFREILDQRGGRVEPFCVEDEPITLDAWIDFISKRIREAREHAGLTQSELEEKTGLPQSHISRLENGVHSPSSSTLQKIANATNQPLSYFDPVHSDVDDEDDACQ